MYRNALVAILLFSAAAVAQTRPASQPSTQPAPPELAAAIAEAITLLEADNVEGFFERFAPATALQELKQRGRFEQAVAEFRKTKDQRLAVLKACRDLPCSLSTDGVHARFEGNGQRDLPTFVKVDGKWYIK